MSDDEAELLEELKRNSKPKENGNEEDEEDLTKLFAVEAGSDEEIDEDEMSDQSDDRENEDMEGLLWLVKRTLQ